MIHRYGTNMLIPIILSIAYPSIHQEDRNVTALIGSPLRKETSNRITGSVQIRWRGSLPSTWRVLKQTSDGTRIVPFTIPGVFGTVDIVGCNPGADIKINLPPGDYLLAPQLYDNNLNNGGPSVPDIDDGARRPLEPGLVNNRFRGTYRISVTSGETRRITPSVGTLTFPMQANRTLHWRVELEDGSFVCQQRPAFKGANNTEKRATRVDLSPGKYVLRLLDSGPTNTNNGRVIATERVTILHESSLTINPHKVIPSKMRITNNNKELIFDSTYGYPNSIVFRYPNSKKLSLQVAERDFTMNYNDVGPQEGFIATSSKGNRYFIPYLGYSQASVAVLRQGETTWRYVGIVDSYE